MRGNEIQRYYLESITANEAAHETLEWVQEKGGTIIAKTKRTFDIVFNLDTSKKRSSFASKRSRDGVKLETMRGGYSINEKRIVYLYLIDKELAKVESHLNLIGTPELKEVLLITQNKDGAMRWIGHYHARPLYCAAENGDQQSNGMVTNYQKTYQEY